ncbi:phiSA1p31-related protein [Streptomyces sp. NPDC002851]
MNPRIAWQAAFPTTVFTFHGITYDLTRPYTAPDGSLWHWTRWCSEHHRPVATRAHRNPRRPHSKRRNH